MDMCILQNTRGIRIYRGAFERVNDFADMEERFNACPDEAFFSSDEQMLNLAKGSLEILRVVISAKENGNTIGIKSSLFGEGFYITAVEDIILEEGKTTVLFKPFDVTGFMLPTNRLLLEEIVAACPLISEFRNPVLRNFEKERNWFF